MNENTSNTNQTAPKTFDIIDGNTLMAQEYEPLRFAVEKILPHGLFIFAGSGKIGKSWLSLDLCVNVATGGKLAVYTFANRILSVNMGNIAPGENVEVTFKATVSEDARGSTIENIATLSGDNSSQLIAPDNGVKIDEGVPVPAVSKSASVSEASVGETVTYTVTATNSIKATADWRNVTISDVMPDGFDFKHGSVYVNGSSAAYSYSGKALTVRLGDLVPGESAVITFGVTVADDAQGETVYNTATVSSDNNTPETSTDNGVKIPEESYGGDPKSVYGSKIADKISVSTGDFITNTIVAGNSSSNSFTWYDVHLYDIINTSLTKMVIDTITIDGRKANAAEAIIMEVSSL